MMKLTGLAATLFTLFHTDSIAERMPSKMDETPLDMDENTFVTLS